VSELCSQLVSKTGQDILTIPFGETEPVLHRLSCSILLLDGIGIQSYLVPGHIPYHSLILFTRLVTGTILEHLAIAIWSRSLFFTRETGIRTQLDLVPGHIPYPGLILFTVLVAGTGLGHLSITALRRTSTHLALAILEFFLNRAIFGHPVLYLQAGACLVAIALSLSLLPGCHDGSWCKDENQHCTQCYFLEHGFHSWRVWIDWSRFTRFHQTISRD
jgi:hypothetical protein